MKSILVMKSKNQTLVIKLLGYAVLIVGLFFIIYKGAMLSIDAHHDGTMFNPALIIANGGVMYKDTSSYYGILTTYIQAAFLVLFGETLWAMRLSAVVFYVLNFIVFFNIFKRLVPRPMVILTEVILLFIAPYWMTTFHAWSSVYALFFILLYMYFCIKYFDSNNKIYMVLIGASTALTLWSRTPCGIVFILVSVLLLAFMVFYTNKDFKKCGSLVLNWLVGAAIVSSLFIIPLLFQGTFKLWWDACIRGPFNSTFNIASAILDKTPDTAVQGLLITKDNNILQNLPLFNSIKRLVECLFPLNNSGIYILLPFASLYVFFSSAWFMYKGKQNSMGEKEKTDLAIVLILSLCALASWHQYFAVSCVRHWYWAGFPMVGVLSYLLYTFFDKYSKGWRIIIAFTALLALSLTTLYERFSIYEIRKEKYSQEISAELCPTLKGIKLSAEQIEFYADYSEMIELLVKTKPERRITNISFSILLESLNQNKRAEIDESLLPIIVSSSSVYAEEYPEYFLAVVIEQKYPEQEMDPRIWNVYFYFPKE